MDLIDRKQAIDALWKLDIEIRPSVIDAIYDMIKYLPAVKSNVVRCKDCKWWDKDEHSKRYGYCLAAKHCHYSLKWEIQIYRTYPEDFYCADAEPREEEGEEDG